MGEEKGNPLLYVVPDCALRKEQHNTFGEIYVIDWEQAGRYWSSEMASKRRSELANKDKGGGDDRDGN